MQISLRLDFEDDKIAERNASGCDAALDEVNDGVIGTPQHDPELPLGTCPAGDRVALRFL
jgi:hypothetical protein